MGHRRLLKEYGGWRTGRLCAFGPGASSWFRVRTLLASASIAVCQTTATGLGLPEQRVDGITYRVTDFVIAESFPVQLRITVELENESTTPRSVTFPDGCVVLIRAYDEGTEPAWDMGSTVACTLALVEVNLAAGERQTFDTGLVSAATILGDSLPDGKYRITAYLRPGQIVELEAGNADLTVVRVLSAGSLESPPTESRPVPPRAVRGGQSVANLRATSSSRSWM